jgi:hypothetical protein
MNKDRLYQFTFLSLLTIVYAIGYFSMEYLVDISTQQFLNIQIENSKREAKEIASLISNQVENNINKETVINNVQKSIEKTDMQIGFICMFDRSGKEICHPNIEKVGKMTLPNESYISGVEDEINSKDFFSHLKNKNEVGGVRKFNDPNRDSEVIYLFPVKDTDWIIASHANLKRINERVESLKMNFILVYITTGSLIVLLSFFMIRLIGSNYENKLEEKNENLSNELINISKLNQDLLNYKSKQSIKEKEEEESVENSENKKRILTYLRNEIITLEIEDIAYIFMEDTITYVKDINGKISNSNSSLDEFFDKLDPAVFFRANRQFIISIKSISKIIKYGNNQLKIEVLPVSRKDIIISKNRVSEFKSWLNK